MDIYLDECTGQMHESPEQCAIDEDLQEGEEVFLVKVTVVARYTYRIIGGKPVATSVAFPESLV